MSTKRGEFLDKCANSVMFYPMVEYSDITWRTKRGRFLDKCAPFCSILLVENEINSQFSGFNVGSIRRPRGDVREIGLLPALEFGIDSEYSSGGDDPPLPAPPVGSEAPEAALKAPRFKAVAAGHLHSLLLCEAGR